MRHFNEYIQNNQWLKKLVDGLSEEDAMRIEDSFYEFKEYCVNSEFSCFLEDSEQGLRCDNRCNDCENYKGLNP